MAYRRIDRPEWRQALESQGRTLRWLAEATGLSPRTVYGYSRGEAPAPDWWLRRVGELLGTREA